MRKFCMLGLVLAFFFNTSSAVTPEVFEYKLDNGLNLFVKPDHRTPVIAIYTSYKIGGSYEPQGITGISHALEHMMFQGTYDHPEGEYFKLLEKQGGDINASTGSDQTIYKVNISKDKLPFVLELEADRMHNLTIDPKAFAKEIEVVKEERKSRTDNSPTAYTYERFKAAAFPGNPYQNPGIGWPSDLDNMTADDLRQWYETWYAPNNASIVIVGDVDPEEVFKLVKKYFDPLKPSPLPSKKPFASLTPVGERNITVERPAKLPYLVMGYNIPTIPSMAKSPDTSWEPYALDIIEGLLDGGESARFAKNLIREQQVVAQADAAANIYDRLPSLFVITATPAPNHTIEQVKNALLQELNKLKSTAISPQELQRVKTQIIAEKTYQRDSLTEQAANITYFENVGLSWREYDNYIQQIKAITPKQIQQAAKKYFVPERQTVAILQPQSTTGS